MATIVRVLGRPPNSDWGVINSVRAIDHKDPMEQARCLMNNWNVHAADRLGYVAGWQFKLEESIDHQARRIC